MALRLLVIFLCSLMTPACSRRTAIANVIEATLEEEEASNLNKEAGNLNKEQLQHQPQTKLKEVEDSKVNEEKAASNNNKKEVAFNKSSAGMQPRPFGECGPGGWTEATPGLNIATGCALAARRCMKLKRDDETSYSCQWTMKDHGNIEGVWHGQEDDVWRRQLCTPRLAEADRCPECCTNQPYYYRFHDEGSDIVSFWKGGARDPAHRVDGPKSPLNPDYRTIQKPPMFALTNPADWESVLFTTGAKGATNLDDVEEA